MSEAPEKIWATFEPHESGKGHPRTYATAQKTKGQEYVRSDIAERQLAEALAERDAAALRSYMVCTACYRTLSEETWRAIDLPKSQVRCPCGATGAWVRGHAFYRERAEAAEADKARLSEAATILLSEIDASSDINAIVGASNPLRAALSDSGAGGWRLVPVVPTRDHLERLATLWGYTLEETADCYGAFLESLPTAPTGDHHD